MLMALWKIIIFPFLCMIMFIVVNSKNLLADGAREDSASHLFLELHESPSEVTWAIL